MSYFIPSRLTISAALAGLSMALSLGSQAQPMRDMGGPYDAMMAPAHMAQRWQARQQELKNKLNLSASQEPAWNTFVAAMRPPAKPAMQGLEREGLTRDALAKMTTPERIDKMTAFYEAHHAQRHSHMKERGEATKLFYGQLSAEQQKVFDAETLPHEPHHRARMMNQGPGGNAH